MRLLPTSREELFFGVAAGELLSSVDSKGAAQTFPGVSTEPPRRRDDLYIAHAEQARGAALAQPAVLAA